jgi:hypothetical protein
MFNLPFIGRRKPEHREVRYVLATRDESNAVRQKRADIRMELEIMALHLTPEQRSAAKARAEIVGQGR